MTFVRAYLGDDQTLYLHVPGALILTVGTVWLLAWSFSGRSVRGDADALEAMRERG